MLLTRERYYKRKVVGGNLLGNVFDKSKGLLSSASKIAAVPYRAVKTMLKNQLKQKALPYVQQKAKDYVQQKAKDMVTKNILNRARQGVKDISNNQKVKKVLNDRSRAILSNIIAGNGLKQL